MSDFEKAYRRWIEMHMAKRKGERLRMLKEQHGYGEKRLLEQAWWPVAGNFDHLHPEYEVRDEDGNYYYLDFAYVREPKPTALESDGFNPHARDADRHSFRKGRRRQNAVVLGGWNVLRFSVDDITDDPEYCRRTLRCMLERWYGEEPEGVEGLSVYHREIVRLATRTSEPITPADVARLLDLGDKRIRLLLHELVEMNRLEPASGRERVRSYRLKSKLK